MRNFIALFCFFVSFAVASEENLFVFSAFIIEKDTISSWPIIYAFNNKGQKKNAQMIGVGWYEYSLITGNVVEFVSEDIHEKIDERKKSTASPKDICDLYGIVFNNKGIEIEEPAFASAFYGARIKNKTQEPGALDFQKQDYSKLLKKLKSAKFYKSDVSEPGFIQLQVEGKPTNIIFARKGNMVVYFRLFFGSKTIDFILLDKTNMLDDAFKKISR